MLCNCRQYPRRLGIHILREIKCLFRLLGQSLFTHLRLYDFVRSCSLHNLNNKIILGKTENLKTVIDVMDKSCPQILEKCVTLLPTTEKSSLLVTSNVDLQWLADRACTIWSAGNKAYSSCTYVMKLTFLYMCIF